MMQLSNREIYLQYETLLLSLRSIIALSEQRVIDDDPDDLFASNVNFFVKSYLISVCSYLEAFLQDIAFKYSQEIAGRINEVNIPHNFIHWRLDTGLKDKHLNYGNIDLTVTKKDIADNISANPYRTLRLFRFLGVNLSDKDEFESRKDLVNSVVKKRNRIVHHNDRAADVSFGDLITYIDAILPYMKAVEEAVFELA